MVLLHINSKSQERAASAIWWPGISRDIKRFIDSCDTCPRNRPTQREQPRRPVELPGRPWENVPMDIFHCKRNYYLVITDYYSRWIEIKQLTSLMSDCVISRVKTVFTTHGIPDVVVSDNGKQFISDEFRKFAKSWCFAQHTSKFKPIFSARELEGRANCADSENIARYRRTGDRSVELPCVAPQCNRRITCSGTNGSSTRHTTARCERTIVATPTPRWGQSKLRSTCQNDVQAMLRSATRCTQITAVTKWRTSVAEIGWGEVVVDTKHCVQK